MPNGWSKQVYVQGFGCELINLKGVLAQFNAWKLQKQYMKVFQNLIIKNLPQQILTVLVIAGKKEENHSRQKFTLRWVNALTSAKKVCRSSKGLIATNLPNMCPWSFVR